MLKGVRIVVVNNFPGPSLGGGEVQLLPVIEGLIEAGAEVRVVAVPGSGFALEAAALGAESTEVPMSVAAARTAAHAVAANAEGAQRVVLIGTGYFTNILVRYAAYSARHARVLNLVAVTPGATLADGGSRTALTVRRTADRATSSWVSAWVAVSRSVADGLLAQGVPAERIRVIPNGVDPDALVQAAAMPLPVGTPERRPLVACAARLEPVKGVEHLVRAAAMVPDAAFAIAGEGSLAARLRELAVAEGVADRVAFLGHVSPVAPLFAAADVVVLPSLSEGMPIAALEAMSFGRPVIASRVGGLPEVIPDGVCGLLVPPADPGALASAIRAVLGDPDTSKLMGEACQRAVRQRFTSARMAAAYVSLVAELTSGRGTFNS